MILYKTTYLKHWNFLLTSLQVCMLCINNINEHDITLQVRFNYWVIKGMRSNNSEFTKCRSTKVRIRNMDALNWMIYNSHIFLTNMNSNPFQQATLKLKSHVCIIPKWEPPPRFLWTIVILSISGSHSLPLLSSCCLPYLSWLFLHFHPALTQTWKKNLAPFP